MSYSKTEDDLNTSVGELANLMIDTFTCCLRHYEALLPYLGKKETSFKIYQTLLQVNILLKKLSEELEGLRVECVIDSLCDQNGKSIQSGGGRKRTMSEESEGGRPETKCLKMGVPFSSNNNCSNASTSENGINVQSENMVPMDNEEGRDSQLHKLGIQCVQNTKSDKQDPNEVVVSLEFSKGNSEIPPDYTSCDTVNNEVSVCFADDEKSAYVADTVSGVNECDKPADTYSQGENDDECVVVYDTSNQEKCEDSTNVSSIDHHIYRGFQGEVGCDTSYQEDRPFSNQKSPVAFTNFDEDSIILIEEEANSSNKGERRSHHSPIRYEKGVLPCQGVEKLLSAEDERNGVRMTKKGKYFCTVCKRVLTKYRAVCGHIKGEMHRINLMKKPSVKDPELQIELLKSHVVRLDNMRFKCNLCNRELFDYVGVQGHVKGKKHTNRLKTAQQNDCVKKLELQNNSCESTVCVSVDSAAASSLPNTVPSNCCESTASDSECSAVACSLADTVTVVEDRNQVILMKHAVRLVDIWTYFDAPFHINKKFFMFHSGKVMCTLCCEVVERNILNVRRHICKLSHLDRINILRCIELENKSSNNQLLDIPGSLKNIVPTTHFDLRNYGFFCRVCNCFCENTVVLSHMTGARHGKKLEEMKTTNGEVTTITI